MLSKEEELRVAAFIDATKSDLAKDIAYASEFYVSSVLWLAEKAKELNEELKIQGVCNGEERHRHYSIDSRKYVTHNHSHPLRGSIDFNNLHHHPPEDHRKLNP